MSRTRVLLTGIGGYGSWYLNELLDTEDDTFEIAGIADPYADLSPRFDELKARQIPVYKSPAEFYVEKKADLAAIVSPIHTHDSYIRECFKNGSHVLCEKPVTGSIEEHEDLIELESKAEFFCAVGFQQCFSRDILEFKKDIINGLFGKPLELKVLRLNKRGTNYYHRNGWAGKLKFEDRFILDSPMQNANAHELQNMFFVLGDEMGSCVKLVSAEAELWKGHPDIENYNAAAARFKTSIGVDILFYTAHCIDDDMNAPLGEYRFEKALIKWDNWGFTAHFNDGTIKDYNEVQKGKGFQKFYDSLDAARSGIPPVCTLKTARSHTHSVSMVQKFDIQDVRKEKLLLRTMDDGDTFYSIPGLSDALKDSWKQSKLPSEIGFKSV